MRWAALMAILSQQPGASSSMNLNEQALQVYDEGVKASAFRASRINCTGTGVTCTQTGVTATLNVSGGGGGGAPTDAEYVTYSSNATLTQERVLTAGTNITLDTSTPGQIIVNSSGGGGGVDNWPLTSFGGGF